MMKQILIALIMLHGFLIHGQCDVAITNVDINTYEVTIEIINSEGCGVQGYGGTNEGINMLMVGMHIPGVDEPWDPDAEGPCYMSSNANHLGWTYGPSLNSTPGNWANNYGIDMPLYSGDVVTISLDNPYNANCDDSGSMGCCGPDYIDYWLDQGECIEFVVWQINFSHTLYVSDGGWATAWGGVAPTWGTQAYPDNMIADNYVLQCPPPPAPDAIVTNIEIQTGCIGDLPVYNVEYMVVNIGEEPITDYCIELWNEDYYQCFDSDLFGNYEIPPGEGQLFTTQFFEFIGVPGGFFVVSVDNVNDEIVTGNNNTTVYYPDEWEECPVECVADTIVITEYENVYITDTLFVELPNDTIIEYVDNFITDTLYVETIDTVYVDVEVFVEVFITDTITEIEYITEYVTDTLYITTVDTVEVIVYEFLTDTVYEYITIDCETGLECIDDPGLVCPDWTSVYLPNTFTPNNDGVNDTWQMVYDLECWVDVEFKIFNRWGGMIYSGMGDYYDSYPYWDGSVNGGDHYASDGVYTYTFYARKLNSTEIFERHGHITIFR